MAHSSTLRPAKPCPGETNRIFEPSTTDIWDAIAECTRALLSRPDVTNESGIGVWGIDPACSLAVTDLEGNPACVTKSKGGGEYEQRDIILWADHHAKTDQ